MSVQAQRLQSSTDLAPREAGQGGGAAEGLEGRTHVGQMTTSGCAVGVRGLHSRERQGEAGMAREGPVRGRGGLLLLCGGATEGPSEEDDVKGWLEQRGRRGVLPDLDATDRFGNTLLILASVRGQARLVRWLLQRGADPNLRNLVGGSALMYASCRGHDTIVALLLDYGAREQQQQQQHEHYSSSYNSRGARGGGPPSLVAAAVNGHAGVVRALLLLSRHGHLEGEEEEGRGAVVQQALWWACRMGHGEAARLLAMAGGADWRRPEIWTAASMGGGGCLQVLEVSAKGGDSSLTHSLTLIGRSMGWGGLLVVAVGVVTGGQGPSDGQALPPGRATTAAQAPPAAAAAADGAT